MSTLMPNDDAAVQQVKKQKTSNTESKGASPSAPAAVINPALLASSTTLRTQFDTSQPYTHLVLRDLFDADFLRKVREEIITNLQATYKETDLFKVFQTGDLANIDSTDTKHTTKLPNLLALRTALYSGEFRTFVRDITGCGELSDKTDCSCNTYAKGGHLLCHDDVIGTRRVSYIVYLTDPDEKWTDADGGALELYPLDTPPAPPTPASTATPQRTDSTPGQPAACPSSLHLPYWNSMAMFTVQPGRSYHAVQEVFTEDNPRLSISGWYHAAHAPDNADQASLQQLQRGADAVVDYTPFTGAPPSTPLTDEDTALLLKYLNPTYLSEDAWKSIAERFQEDGSVQLRGFLRKGIADMALQTLITEDTNAQLGNDTHLPPNYHAGVQGGWVLHGPPHKQRYLTYEGPVAELEAVRGGGGGVGMGPLLAHLRNHLFGSGAFARLLTKFTTLTMESYAGQVRRFRPGLDYTVAHYGILTNDPRLDCVLCFCDDREEAGDAWEAGEVGGFEAYLLADEEERSAAEVYRQDAEDSGVLNVNAAHGCLNLVLRDEGLMRFVKYVSSAAPSSRWDVAMEYKPEDDSDEEEGGGEKGD